MIKEQEFVSDADLREADWRPPYYAAAASRHDAVPGFKKEEKFFCAAARGRCLCVIRSNKGLFVVVFCAAVLIAIQVNL